MTAERNLGGRSRTRRDDDLGMKEVTDVQNASKENKQSQSWIRTAVCVGHEAIENASGRRGARIIL